MRHGHLDHSDGDGDGELLSQVQIVILTIKLSIKTIMMMLAMFLFTSRRGPGSPLGERESETLSFYQVILFENRSQNVRISTCFLL